ncbi:MAG: hypothetical protein R3B70_33345 [Polyangiaceae bacterium]
MRRLRLLPGHALAAGAVVLALSGSGCQQQSIEQTLPALQESGRISFVCLGPSESDSPFLPLRACRNIRSDNACDFSSGDGGAAGTTGGTGGTGGDTGGAGGGGAGGSNAGGAAPEFSGTPHLYGLVTQTFRGEVALIDLTGRPTIASSIRTRRSPGRASFRWAINRWASSPRRAAPRRS